MSGPIRVLVADDDALVRSGLSLLLAATDDIRVVAESADGTEVGPAVDAYKPDLVLMDIRMPRMDGLAATELLRARDEAPEVIVLTTFDADEHVLRALRAGASGFLLKDTPPEEIVAAIRKVAAGELMLSPQITRRLVEQVADSGAEARRASPRCARAANRARARGRAGARRGEVERRDRRRAVHERRHRQGARLEPALEARAQQPRADRPAGARRGRQVNVDSVA